MTIQLVAIPPHFYRTLETAPFDSCDSCYRPLRTEQRRYRVIKQYIDHMLHRETAICLTCRDDWWQADHSAFQAIQARIRTATGNGLGFEAIPTHCCFCVANKQDLDEYVIYMLGEAATLVNSEPPFLVCAPCLHCLFSTLPPATQARSQEAYQRTFLLPTTCSVAGTASMIFILA